MEVLPAKEGPAKRKKSEEEEPARLNKTWLFGIIGLLIVLLAVVLFFILRDRSGNQSKTPSNANNGATVSQQPVGPRKWYVAKNKLDGIDFTSIAAAVGQAGPGDTVVITDRQVYSEALVLIPSTSSRGFSNVTIIAEISDDGKRAKLVPPRNHQPITPLIQIEGVSGLKISGLLLDGEDALQSSLSIKGSCPGLIVEDVRIEGFQRHGIIVDNLSGTGRREVQFNKVHVRQNSPQPAQSAILIQGSQCDGLQLRQCRLQGPYASTLMFSAPIQRFLMEQCKLYGGKGNAILWAETIPPNQRMNATIQQNTFWDFTNGLGIDAPMNANDIYFTVRNNLFYQVKSLLHVDPVKAKMKPEGLAAGWAGLGNVFDLQTSQPGMATQIPKFGVKGIGFTLNTSLTPPEEFLRFPAGSSLQSAGERNDPVGATD